MEVVIRTAHGGADVDLSAFDDDTTLRDLLTAVTGLAVPTVVDIDGRPCRVDDAIVDVIDDAGLRIGSIIDVTSTRSAADTAPGVPWGDDTSPSTTLVELRQLSGRGTGETVPLSAGSYRFGAGRRLVERELGMAVVEEEAFAITVRPPDRISGSDDHAPPSDARAIVTVRPGAHVSGELGSFTPTLGGQLFDRPLRWTDERLSVGGRVFELAFPGTKVADDAAVAIGAARIGRPDRAGVRSFDAAGTVAARAGDVSIEPTFGALDRLDDPSHALWRRRPHDDRLAVPIGLSADHRSVVAVDLDRHGGIAVSGSADFTAGVARTVLVELATMLGPGDLDVVIVASAGRLGRWDWTKWLPHVRGGDPTAPPRFLTTDDDIAAWREHSKHESAVGTGPDGHPARRTGWAAPKIDPSTAPPPSGGLAALPPPTGRPHARPSVDQPPRRTLLVVDDAAHWTRRHSPLRSLLVDPHASIRVLATIERLADAPVTCTALVDELRPDELIEDGRPDGAAGTIAATRLFGSLCRLIEQLGANPVVTTDVRPAMTQRTTATRITLGLASYDDLRVRRNVDHDAIDLRSDRPTVGDLAAATADAPEDDGSSRPTVAIGRVAAAPDEAGDVFVRGSDNTVDEASAAMVDLANAGVTAIAVDEPDDRHVLAAIARGAAARCQPDELAILIVAGDEPRWLTPLPHVIGTVDGDDTEQLGRVLQRVAATLSRDRDFEVLVIVDGAVTAEGPPRLSDATLAFLELATSLEQVHLVVSTASEHADMLRRHLGTSCGAFVEGRRDGTATLARHDEGLDIGTARIMPTVDLLLPVARTAPPPAPSAGLRVHPFVHGRPLSPIERRLARHNDSLRIEFGGTSGERSPGVVTDDTATTGGETSEVDDGPARSGLPGAGGHRAQASQLLPPPFPDQVGQETLFAADDERVAGMLPLGIIDRAHDPGLDVLRWAPSSGNLIAVGHRRSGMGVLVELVAAALVGIDADIWVLDPLPQRRRAFRRLRRCRKTADPESSVAVERFLDDLEDHLDHLRPASSTTSDGGSSEGSDTADRTAASEPTRTPIRDEASASEHLAEAVRGGPRPVIVVIADLNRTLACFGDDEAPAVVDRLAALSERDTVASSPGDRLVSLVVSASHRHEVEPLIGSAADVLVGGIDDEDRASFGVPDRSLRSGSDDVTPGRCWSTARQRLVQLATPPQQLEQFVRHRSGDLTADEIEALTRASGRSA